MTDGKLSAETFQKYLNVFQDNRFGQIVDGTITDGLLGIGKIRVSAQDYSFNCRIFFSENLKKLQSCHSRHTDIHKHNINMCFFEQRQSFLSIGCSSGHLKTIAAPFYKTGQSPAYNFFIIYD